MNKKQLSIIFLTAEINVHFSLDLYKVINENNIENRGKKSTANKHPYNREKFSIMIFSHFVAPFICNDALVITNRWLNMCNKSDFISYRVSKLFHSIKKQTTNKVVCPN